jgi:hypothetical protein
MLNRLQKVPYRINDRVLELANFCMERRLRVGKFSSGGTNTSSAKARTLGDSRNRR